jgi:hypothetical protein
MLRFTVRSALLTSGPHSKLDCLTWVSKQLRHIRLLAFPRFVFLGFLAYLLPLCSGGQIEVDVVASNDIMLLQSIRLSRFSDQGRSSMSRCTAHHRSCRAVQVLGLWHCGRNPLCKPGRLLEVVDTLSVWIPLLDPAGWKRWLRCSRLKRRLP